MKHPHADEKRKPTLERQLEGTGLFSQDEASDLDRSTVERLEDQIEQELARLSPEQREAALELRHPGPHRVGRRATAQDRAHGAALIHQGTHIEMILTHLRKDYQRGLTREQLGQALGIKLQTVCGRVNDLLKRERDGKPAPLVYEKGEDPTGAAYVYAFTPESLTLTHDRT